MRRVKALAAKLLGRHAAKVRAANESYDMSLEPDELYYQEQYLHWILPELDMLNSSKNARILDLGCGHGRLTLPLARWAARGSALGVDFSPRSLESARRAAASAGLTNVEFTEADAAEFMRRAPSASFDAIVCAEMLYNLPEYKQTLAEIFRALKPGGLLFASFRSQWYELLRSVRARDFESAKAAAKSREGHWGGGAVWSCWHTPQEVAEQLSAAGFEPPELRAIGPLSGLQEDAISAVAQPSKLDPAEREALLEVELVVSEQYAGQGRYILAIARRPL